MRAKKEIEARIDLVKTAPDFDLTSVFDEAEEATKKMSPSSAFILALKIGGNLGSGKALAIAKAVRWQRVLERDY